jgi:GNAT superfamily N-acetyltransferase
MVEVIEVDPHDEAALRAYWETEQAAVRHDRPHAILRSWLALSSSTRSPGPFHRRQLLAAREGGRTIGVADLGFWLQGNDHLAGLEVSVLPGHRRRGVGRALHEEAARRCREAGRTTVCGEVHVPAGESLSSAAPGRFAAFLGYASAHEEDHLVLRLPLPARDVRRLQAAIGDHAAAYDVVTWGNRCPDEHVEALCAMNTQMSADVPSGELDVEPVVWDEERLRTSEERTAASYDRVTAVVRRRSDGVLGGYSLLYLPKGEDHVLQDDTLVMPDHRGHRLGLALKLATLDVLSREHPERRTLHTWTDPENRAMHRTNLGFGYTVVERMHEMQRKDA